MRQIYHSEEKKIGISQELGDHLDYITKNLIDTHVEIKYDEAQELSIIELENSVMVYYRRFEIIGEDHKNVENRYFVTDLIEFYTRYKLINMMMSWGYDLSIFRFNRRAKEIMESIN